MSDSELVAVWKACPDNDFGKIVRTSFTLPAERTKNAHSHTLPLLPLAQAIIASVPQVVGHDHVFGVRGNGFTRWQRAKQALDDHLVNVVDAWNLHDLRRTLATRMVELDVEPHVVEAILTITAATAAAWRASTTARNMRGRFARR